VEAAACGTIILMSEGMGEGNNEGYLVVALDLVGATGKKTVSTTTALNPERK
jgi:hypothetical protein